MGDPRLSGLIDAAAQAIAGRAHELDALDAAIGDGDHGTNLARGLTAVAARRDELAGLPLPDALSRMGEVVAAEAGGEGGRLYGALIAGIGRSLPPGPVDLHALAHGLAGGVAALREAGGGTAPGDKTMVDVLQPVADVLGRLAAEGKADGLGGRALAAAAHGLHRTSRLPARRGRAADLGEAAIHHLDAGAWSSALLVGAAVGVLEDGAAA